MGHYRTQRIKVNTKGGLLAAFECAKDHAGETLITLQRKTGVTTYILKPWTESHSSGAQQWTTVYWTDFNKAINQARAQIHRTKAADLLG